MGFGGGGKGRYDVRDDEPCHGCGQNTDTMLNYCGMCWHIYVDTQQRNHGGEAQHLFFPPELDHMMFASRRAAYTRSVENHTERHRLAIRAQQDRERQEQDDMLAEQAHRDRARVTTHRAACEVAAADEDTFVLSNWIANKYIYIYIYI